ncbi:hypothetical protein EYF80_042749 [Liparis tanakae]|uniref:Uncharacterized protein n=1 Tax=Liparis tanakae TaxID=230148 RepID=A0A4Z2G1V0_9TELE|nr:hypothetical protein EYF80_042749 [Liparis tanakae]
MCINTTSLQQDVLQEGLREPTGRLPSDSVLQDEVLLAEERGWSATQTELLTPLRLPTGLYPPDEQHAHHRVGSLGSAHVGSLSVIARLTEGPRPPPPQAEGLLHKLKHVAACCVPVDQQRDLEAESTVNLR